MSQDPKAPTCPKCGALVKAGDARCPSCHADLGEDEILDVVAVTAEPTVRRRPRLVEDLDDEDDDDRPRRSYRREDEFEATDLLVPTNVSIWAILSCYMGLIGFCIPVIGLVFAVPALIFGIIAIRKRKASASYGAVTGNVRAVIGIVLSSLAIISSLTILLLIATGKFR